MQKGKRPYRDWETEGFPKWLQDRMRDQSILSARELGRRAGVGDTLITRWMTGKQKPNIASLQKVARALQVSDDEILVAAEFKSPAPDAAPLEPRRTELHNLLDALDLTHERYLMLNSLMRTLLDTTPPLPASDDDAEEAPPRRRLRGSLFVGAG